MLRELCCNHINEHENRFSQIIITDYNNDGDAIKNQNSNFNSYITKLRIDASWADYITIIAIEEILDRHIRILNYDNIKKTTYLGDLHDGEEKKALKDVNPIILSYHTGNHYCSVYNYGWDIPLKTRYSDSILKIRTKLCNNNNNNIFVDHKT